RTEAGLFDLAVVPDQDPHGPHVGAVVDGLEVQLLGRHVGPRAGQRAADSHRGLVVGRCRGKRGRLDPLGDPEVEHLDRSSVTFSGLRSGCTMPWSCAYASARTTGRIRSTAW